MQLLASAISRWLIRENRIVPEQQNLYAYACICAVLGVLPILLALLWGIVFGSVLHSLILVMPIMLLRKFSGGFHFHSAWLCALTTAAVLGALNWSIPFFAAHRLVANLLALAAAILVICVSPIASPQKPLTQSEKTAFGKIARAVVVAMLALLLVLNLCASPQSAVALALGITLVGALQLPCIISSALHRGKK